jgi:lipoprotein signal peptidase
MKRISFILVISGLINSVPQIGEFYALGLVIIFRGKIGSGIDYFFVRHVMSMYDE